MGWWGTSSREQADSRKHEQQSLNNPQPEINAASPPPLQDSKKASRDDLAEAELKEFLASINNSPAITPIIPATKTNAFDQPATSTPTSSFASPTSTESQFAAPTSSAPISCREAFDYAYFCQSFGGQWVNVYRYGELRSCKEHWSEFWFCMRSKAWPDDERSKALADRQRRKLLKYKTGPSSEDIWEIRNEPVRDAFQGDYLAMERETAIQNRE